MMQVSSVRSIPTPVLAAARVAAVAVFAAALVASAQVRMPLPGTPVPITLQTLIVPLAALTLGPWLGSAAVAFYLLLGVTGTQAFAVQSTVFPGWSAPTGGYLLGFLLAQPLVGWMTSRGRTGWMRIAGAVAAANVVIFACGLVWLNVAMGHGGNWQLTLAQGLWPFVSGAIAKGAGSCVIGWPAVRRVRPVLGCR